MYTPTPKTLLDYRTTPWSEVQNALADLLRREKELVEKGGEPMVRLFGYIEPVGVLAAISDEDDVVSAIDREILHLLEAELLQDFLANPANTDLQDMLGLELALVAAATDRVKGFKPYTLEELQRIMAGDNSIYNDLIFALTLREQLFQEEKDNDVVVGTFLLNSLPLLNAAKYEREKYMWDDMFLFTLILHVAWKTFAVLPPILQQRMLQQYFYISIVLGVPVRRWVTDGVEIMEKQSRQLVYQGFVQSIATSEEAIFRGTGDERIEFTQVVKQYFERTVEESVGTPAQEKFLEEFFQSTRSDAIQFEQKNWLREALNISLRLRQQNLI